MTVKEVLYSRGYNFSYKLVNNITTCYYTKLGKIPRKLNFRDEGQVGMRVRLCNCLKV
jgi:hypothetical protein